MTCPNPEYCALNGCSGSRCHSSRQLTIFSATGVEDALPGPDGDRRFFVIPPRAVPTERYRARSRRTDEPGDWGAAVVSTATGRIYETFPHVGAAALQAARWNYSPTLYGAPGFETYTPPEPTPRITLGQLLTALVLTGATIAALVLL